MGQQTATRRTLIWTATIAVVLLGIFVVSPPWWVDAAMQAARQGSEHRFELNPPPSFLTEEVALEKARGTLRLDGYDPNDWVPNEDERSTAPDGRADRYLVSNTLNRNHGYILFSRSEPWGVRTVHLELDESTLVTRVCLPK